MAARKKPGPDDDGSEAFIPLPRTLVGDVHVENPEGGGIVEFKAGTPETSMPSWAVDGIGNPHAWSDSRRDERVEFLILPRLAAAGAPVEMLDDLRQTLDQMRDSDEYDEAVRETLLLSSDAGALAKAIVAYRQDTEKRGGETYAEYVARAGELGSSPVSFDEFLASPNGVVIEDGDTGAATRGGETYEQYVARAGMAPNVFEPVDEAVWLDSPPDVAVGAAQPAQAPVTAADATAGTSEPAQPGQGGVTVESVVGEPDVTLKIEKG